ncbi:MAG: ComEC family competence protein [Bacteroidia bacterium]|jgi:competence protein ComEC|nr:ComEC family competence protein [Bacteroidia bacterium]
MIQTFWHRIPIVRILVVFVLGIWISFFTTVYPLLCWILIFVFLSAHLFLVVNLQQFSKRWMQGFSLLAVFFVMGTLIRHYQNPMQRRTHFAQVSTADWLVVRLIEMPVKKKTFHSSKAEVIAVVEKNRSCIQTQGFVMVNIKLDSFIQPPFYGDIILVSSQNLSTIKPPANPGEFNYKSYLALQHIYHQLFVTNHNTLFTGVNKSNNVYALVYQIQNRFKEVLHKYIKEENEVGVAQALLYGFDDAINEETIAAYANTGTLHVLAVSGMHVGIIYYLINVMLVFMDRSKRLKQVKQLIILLVIWGYSVLCGLSPSILRATVMFSFVIVAGLIQRRSNVYNTLAASCLTLICVNANMLANVGFQLSYLAVLGIVFIQPLLYKWYVPRFWIVDQIWKITSVSIAAQLTTSPIGILYFKQFPNCFLLSNLLIIPLTTIILYGCMLLLCLSFIPLIAEFSGIILCRLISFTNQLAMWIEELPNAYVNGIYIVPLQSIALYLVLFGICWYLIYKQSAFLLQASLGLLLFLCIKGIKDIQQSLLTQAWVYAIPGETTIQFFYGKRSVLFLSHELYNNKSKFRYYLQQHIWENQVEQTDTFWLSGNYCYQINGVLITNIKNCSIPEQIQYVVSSHVQPKSNKSKAKLIYTAKPIKPKPYQLKQDQRDTNNIYWNVMKSGAIQLSL